MTGKLNIVFGFIFLTLTAALGPYMVNQLGTVAAAASEKQQAFGRIQLLASTGFEDPDTLEPISAERLAQANSTALLALNEQLNARAPIDAIKGGPHAHGNLEALLNIVVGLLLPALAIPVRFKQVIGALFLLGALFHAGMLYLVTLFQLGWAGTVLGTGIGPVMLLTGFLLAGVAAALGLPRRYGADTPRT